MVSWLKSLTLVFLLPLELFAEGKVSGAVNQSHVFEQGKIEVEIQNLPRKGVLKLGSITYYYD